MDRIQELTYKLTSLKKGGGIHIKKENRGKFTSYCGGKVTAACIARGKSSPNPAIRKRATFAANARKWKHASGGVINKNFSENLKYINSELQKAGYGYIQRLAILGNIQRESNGNPLAVSSNGIWHGLIQWDKDRYRIESDNSKEELKKQTKLLIKELERKGWAGKTWKDQETYSNSFKDSTDLNQAIDLLTRKFVRPGNIDEEIKKRLGYAKDLQSVIEDDRKSIIDNNEEIYTNDWKQTIFNKDNINHIIEMSPYKNQNKFISSFEKESENYKPSVLKKQYGGLLVYNQYKPNDDFDFDLDITDYSKFPVERVRKPVSKQNEVKEETVPEIPIIDVSQNTQTEPKQTTVQVQNPEVIVKPTEIISENQNTSTNAGRVYKSSEKDEFKQNMYNAYYNALIKRGESKDRAKRFAQRLATQDANESNYGQSSLARDYNFGGIKDFRKNSTAAVKDTVEYNNGKRQVLKQPFRKFANLDEYINYKVNLMDRNWRIFDYDPDQMYHVITNGKRKYATAPNYANILENWYKQMW